MGDRGCLGCGLFLLLYFFPGEMKKDVSIIMQQLLRHLISLTCSPTSLPSWLITQRAMVTSDEG